MEKRGVTKSNQSDDIDRLKPKDENLFNCIILHEIKFQEKIAVKFTRCQKRSITNALKRLEEKHIDAREIYRCNNVPNGMHVLNCVKEKLQDLGIKYEAQHNILMLTEPETFSHDQIVELVKDLLIEHAK